MNKVNKMSISEIAREYGITNEQLKIHLSENKVWVFNDDDKIDMLQNDVKIAIEKLKMKREGDHVNNSDIKEFRITGLFGDQDIEIDFKNDISILVSENGAGKTTVLKLLIALLQNNYKYLRSVRFKKISLKLGEQFIYYDKSDFETEENIKDLRVQSQNLFLKLRGKLPYEDFINVENELKKSLILDLEVLDFIEEKFVKAPTDYHDEVMILLRKLREKQESLVSIKNDISFGKEIIFCPTYRRVEDDYTSIYKVDFRSKNYNFTGQPIEFGMRDVRRTIDNLLNKQRMEANFSYRKMSEDIFRDLIKNKISISSCKEDTIDFNKIDVIVNRAMPNNAWQEGELKSYYERQNNETKVFFEYYVTKLIEIYDYQKIIDDKLEKFAKICTKYLESKTMKYDVNSLSLNIYDNNDRVIDLEWLSSGEKQIISIFSKVYLECVSPCVFIIDEPELSLSIEWQRTFLKDIYESGKVDLLIATTHSPFIFDNEYFEYTTSLTRGRK
ncbi:hypothetical protein HMPREF3103_01020 [Granulicatella sp. HMSC30F09]|jgi:hypothetical protein|uniref:AAA family ATPase n=1 Tax=Granulicatella sp. HMSC30F09 TaxID=1581071 RepID=UPI0008A59ABD|nr:AAA family ATPase [Granulicatella sp. HMSC30F09]OFT81394.1 hypothetical protein HMPREF3103_01020 [Granulicatella sp. HMSC30F09]